MMMMMMIIKANIKYVNETEMEWGEGCISSGLMLAANVTEPTTTMIVIWFWYCCNSRHRPGSMYTTCVNMRSLNRRPHYTFKWSRAELCSSI